MDLNTLKEWFTLENIMELIKAYRSFGPLPGILLPMLEAFLPFLPLFLFVMANANAFGLWFGFLFSWIGAFSGALLVFLLIRKFGQKRALQFIKRHPQVQKLMLMGGTSWFWSFIYSSVFSIHTVSHSEYSRWFVKNQHVSIYASCHDWKTSHDFYH